MVFLAFLGGLVIFGALFKLSRVAISRSEGSLRRQVDARLDSMVLGAIAKRLGVEREQLERSGAGDEIRLQALNIFGGASFEFLQNSSTAVRLVALVRWRDGNETKITEEWNYDDVPVEVQTQFIRTGRPVIVNWDWPEIALTAVD